MLLTKSCESAVDLLKNRRDDLSRLLSETALAGEPAQAGRNEPPEGGAYWMLGYAAAMNDVLALFGRSDYRRGKLPRE